MKKNRYSESQEYLYAIKKIDNFYKSNNKILGIVSSPYNSIEIFSPILNEAIKSNSKVLYVCGEKSLSRKIIENTTQKKYSLKEDEYHNIVILNFDEAIKIKNSYDLIIVDEISSIYFSNKIHIKLLVDFLYNKSKKIISYSVDKILNYGDTITISNINNSNPILEPRILITKIDLKKDIPFSLYEYLQWFNSRKRKVLILVEDIESYMRVFQKYNNNLRKDDIKLITIDKENKHLNKINLTKDKTIFIMTNQISNYIKKIKDLDIVVLDADRNMFNYKTIVYLSAILGNNSKEAGELILVTSSISSNIKNSQNIIRKYNKSLWKKGLLKY